jgi:hypothetical protein
VFTIISSKYQSIMEQLISPDGETRFPDLATFFPDFRAMQTARPFICTFARCPRNSEGFPSIQERDAHEHSHRPRIMCGEASCQFATAIGFASRAQLNRHTKKYHQAGPRSIPAFPQPRLKRWSASDAEGFTRTTVNVNDGGEDEVPLNLDAASSAFPETHRTGFEDPTDLSQIGNRLSSLDLDTLPLEFQHIGTDWRAVYNPNIEREIEVEHIHSLIHVSVVCSVCFSQDGSRMAATSNHTIRVFDVVTGNELALLESSFVHDGDSYYRSACFLPDSRFLVSGSERKTVDVSIILLTLDNVSSSDTHIYRYGTPTLVKSVTHMRVMRKIYIVSMRPMTANSSSLVRETEPYAFGITRRRLLLPASKSKMASQRSGSHQIAFWSLLVHLTIS